VKERAITLRDWEVSAIVEGRKTQMRFVMKPQPHPFIWKFEQLPNGLWQGYERDSDRNRPRGDPVKLPDSVGDRLLGRETWQPTGVSQSMGTQIHYKVGGCEWKSGGRVSFFPARWRSPATMPRWAGRVLLEVTQVRLQQVQEITEEDAIAEGSQIPLDQLPKKLRSAVLTERCMFARLWNYVHGPDAWTRNDWVRVVTFRKI
jgi:hypothetical protein